MTKKKVGTDLEAVTEVVYEGEKLVLPQSMSLDSAIAVLNRRKEYDNKRIVMHETFDVFPFDGACALDTVLRRRYGWAPATSTPGFFRDHPPELISVQVGADEVRQVPWGAFLLPNVDGRLTTDTGHRGDRLAFALRADILRRDEQAVQALFNDLRAETRRSSIYRGKAVKLRFRDEHGEALEMPQPEFLRVEDVDETALVYSAAVERAIVTNLFVPITRARDCVANGISVKRGVLLGGTFGTGKTLAATVAAKLAVGCGVTYVYVPRADELTSAIEFAKQYQSPACVIFCEDIDRVTTGARSVEMDDILNAIDGIDSKDCNIIVVLTTNALEQIHPAMLRPGRLDAVIEVTPPDAQAVERLLRVYGGEAISPSTDLTAVAQALEGHIPAVIAEVVKRAKLAQLAMQPPGSRVKQVSSEALLEAARGISAQVQLLRKADSRTGDSKEESMEGAFERAMKRVLNGNGELLNEIARQMRRIEEAVA